LVSEASSLVSVGSTTVEITRSHHVNRCLYTGSAEGCESIMLSRRPSVKLNLDNLVLFIMWPSVGAALSVVRLSVSLPIRPVPASDFLDERLLI